MVLVPRSLHWITLARRLYAPPFPEAVCPALPACQPACFHAHSNVLKLSGGNEILAGCFGGANPVMRHNKSGVKFGWS